MDVRHGVDSSSMRFGLFIAPFHPLDGNPTLQLRRDLHMAVLADELGFVASWPTTGRSTSALPPNTARRPAATGGAWSA